MTVPVSGLSDGPVYHIALASDWAAAQATGDYRISTLGRTLAEEGYIHASSAEQVHGVLTAFYGGVSEPLLLLAIDPGRLGCEIRLEEAVPGGDLFPHIYGPIPVDAVLSATPIERDTGA